MLQAVNMVITRVPAIELSPVSVTSREHVLDAVPRVRNVKLATSVSWLTHSRKRIIITPQTVMRVEFHPASNMAEHGKWRFYGMPIDNTELV